jgi:hypothetical protein
VGRGVGGRQGDGDHEVGGHEAEQCQDEQLALPPAQQALEHGDGALAVRALGRHLAIHRQGAEQRQQDQDEGRDRRERAGGQGGNPGLIAERREVVDPRQAHHPPPGVLVVARLLLVLVGALDLARLIL